MGRDEEAKQAAADGVMRAPGNHLVQATAGMVALLSGDDRVARERLERSLPQASVLATSSHAWSPVPALGLLLTRAGDRRAADRILERREREALGEMERGNEATGLRYELAGIAAVRGDRTAAHVWLRKAVDAGWRRDRLLARDPVFATLRADPQFRTVLQEVRRLNTAERARAGIE